MKANLSIATLCMVLALPLWCGCTAADPWQSEYGAGLTAFGNHDFVNSESNLKKAAHSAITKGRTVELADTLTMLGRVYSEQGKFADAEPLLKDALAIYRDKMGPHSVRVAVALNELASCHHKQGEYSQAEALCLEALAINMKALGPDTPSVASTANNLAEIYQKEGKDDAAEPLFRQALAVYSKTQQNPDSAKGLIGTLNNLAIFYQKQGRFGEAKQSVEQALTLQRKTFGQDSAGVGVELGTRAGIERAMFDLDLAAKDYQQSIEILQKSEKQYEQVLCETNDLYADLLLDQKDFAKAEPVYKIAINHCIHSHGPNHPCVAERLDDLAQLYRETGRFTEAEKALRQALAINRASFRSDSPIVFNTMNELSAVYVDQHKFAQAQEVYSEWIPSLKKVLGEDHPHVADALENWAMVATKAKDTVRANQLLAQAKGIRRRSAHPVTVSPASSDSASTDSSAAN